MGFQALSYQYEIKMRAEKRRIDACQKCQNYVIEIDEDQLFIDTEFEMLGSTLKLFDDKKQLIAVFHASRHDIRIHMKEDAS